MSVSTSREKTEASSKKNIKTIVLAGYYKVHAALPKDLTIFQQRFVE